MKRIIFLLFIFLMLPTAVSCSGTFSKVDLNNPVPLPENGIVEKDVLEQVKNDGAIATFVGESNGFEYKWIIFGKDINEAKNVNLSVGVSDTGKGILLQFSEKEDYGFTALLSVYLHEKWTALGATAYCDGEVFGSVSITGSKESILNVTVDKAVEKIEIVPDEANEETEDNTESDKSELSQELPILSEDDLSSENSCISTESMDGIEESVSVEDVVLSNDSENSEPFDTSLESSDLSESVYSETDDSSIIEDNAGETETNSRPVSDGKDTSKDKYETDPVPEGKPLPVEPENQEINQNKTYTCTISIECSTILNNLFSLDSDKLELIPTNGVILAPTEVTFYEGESVFDVLKRICKEKNIHLEFSWTPIYNSAYIEGIYNLYEFDCGELSGWMYRVNGWYPNYGCSRYQLTDGEVIEWRYTCDLGRDVGEDRLGQS